MVKVEFVITKKGEAGKMRITGSSNYKMLDEAALVTLKRASPFPGLSEELGEELKITIPIVYRLVE